MTTSDLDQLISMGFDNERASIAVKQTGSLTDAIDWLDSNSDRTIEDIQKEIEAGKLEDGLPDAPAEAKSLVCNECGKKFRGTAQAEWHASKTEHTDFSESTEEIAPLTEEEKKAKLEELREKMLAKKAVQAEQEKIDKRRNEEINRKKTKESQDIKEQLKVKEQIKDAEKKRREKQEDIEAKKRIQAKIAADKEERRLRTEREKAERAGVQLPSTTTVATTPAPAAVSKPASEYTETRLRLQTPNGNLVKTFPVNATLFEVASAVGDEIGLDVESFTQNFPRKVYDREYFGESLKDLKLIPSASLIVK